MEYLVTAAAIRSNKERLAMANRQIALSWIQRIINRYSLEASQYSEQSLREEIAEIVRHGFFCLYLNSFKCILTGQRYTLIKVCSADNERAAKRDAEVGELSDRCLFFARVFMILQLNRHAMMAEQAEPPRVGKVKSLIFQLELYRGKWQSRMRKNYGDVSGLECGPLWPAVNRTQMTGFVVCSYQWFH